MFAVASLALACNPKMLKPNYCFVDTDCPSGQCDNTDGGTFMCLPRDGSADRGDAADGPSKCTLRTQCADGGLDGGSGVCEVEAGTCVECLQDSDCTRDPKTPICESHACRPCKADSECKSEPNICLGDGHCATSDQVIFVDHSALSCPGTGTAASPFCMLPSATSVLLDTRNVIVVRGPADDKLILNTTGVLPVVIGKKNSSGDNASVPAGAGTAILVSSDHVLIRDLTATGGTATSSKGIVATGSSTMLELVNVQVNLTTAGLGIQADSGATLVMDRCTVTGNSVGGLLISGASYDVQNSVFGGNGYGIKFNASPIPAASRMFFVTIAGNTGNALTCDSTNMRTITDSIVVGLNDSCTVTNSFTTAQDFRSTPPYHLTRPIACPGAPAGPLPTHDIDNEPRVAPLDCGADQFLP